MRVPSALTALLTIPALLAAAGCGSQSGASAPPTPAPTVEAAATGPQAIVASSDLAVGRNRFTFGVLNNNHPVETGTPHLTFFTIKGNGAQREGTAIAHFNQFARGLKDTDANAAAVEIGGV